jgi:A/G-specific adenine glycosylase
MELGATLCSKQGPRCRECPLRAHCVAYVQGRAEALPLARKKRPPRRVALVALLATRQHGKQRELWLDRGEGSLFAGLWNLPMAEGRGRKAANELLDRIGLRGSLATRAEATLEHVLTHRKLHVQLWRVQDAHASRTSKLRAVPLPELEQLGVSKLTHKALDELGLGAQLQLGA